MNQLPLIGSCQQVVMMNKVLLKVYPGPRGFLLFFIGKFCDANRFLYFLLARNAESREKKASGRDRWEPHFHAISFRPSFVIGGYF